MNTSNIPDGLYERAEKYYYDSKDNNGTSDKYCHGYLDRLLGLAQSKDNEYLMGWNDADGDLALYQDT